MTVILGECNTLVRIIFLLSVCRIHDALVSSACTSYRYRAMINGLSFLFAVNNLTLYYKQGQTVFERYQIKKKKQQQQARQREKEQERREDFFYLDDRLEDNSLICSSNVRWGWGLIFYVLVRANATAFSRLCQLSRATFG